MIAHASHNTPLPASGGRRGAFTLIELLVVVAIIALLIAIILPAVGKAKAKSNEVVCATRIKGLTTATLTYLSEFDNTFPINGVILPKAQVPSMYMSNTRFSSQEQTNQEKWRPEFGALWTVINGNAPDSSATLPLTTPSPNVLKALLCPSDAPSYQRGANGNTSPALTLQNAGNNTMSVKQGPNAGGYWSYSVNSVLNSLGRFRNKFTNLPWADPLKMTSVQNPSNFFFFIEEANDSLFNDEVFDAPAFGGGDHITNRHNNGGNVGFGDGHVEKFNEVQFDNGGQNADTVDPVVAMQAPVTRSFFPDGGEFAAYTAP